MWSSGRRVLQDLLSQPAVRSFSLTPVQNTVVVERWWQVPLSKVGSPPRLYPRRHRVYKLVSDTKHNPTEKMKLILTQIVPKFGGRGETVFVKKSIGRNKLLPQGLAVYPSPENMKIFAEELRLLREGKLEERIQTRTGLKTVEFLKTLRLTINKAPTEEFQLTKEMVCREFAKQRRVVVPPHALTLPSEPIKELGDYWCEVTVNGLDTVRIPMSLVPYQDKSAKYRWQLKAQRQQEEAADSSEDAGKEDSDLKAVSADAAVEPETCTDSVSPASAGSSSESTDQTAPTSEKPEKN